MLNLSHKSKGVTQLYGITIGLIVLFVGVALMYMLPEYIIGALNSTGVFTAAQVSTALAQAGQVRSLGFVVIIISVIWIVFSVVGAPSPQA
jgi:membrane-anchored glycerophosphoryl diester phosphodiesterase (GDPDase)